MAQIEKLSFTTELNSKKYPLEVVHNTLEDPGGVLPELKLFYIRWNSNFWHHRLSSPAPRKNFWELTQGGSASGP